MADVLESLIADAYGSLTGPEGHAAFVRSLTRAFRSHLIALQVDGPGHEHMPLAHYDQNGRNMVELAAMATRQPYTNPWFESPMIASLFRKGVEGSEGFIPANALRRTEFYADILKPFDIFHSMGMVLEQGSQTAVLSLSRSQQEGYYSHRELECAKQLLPHLRKVHAIQKVVAIGDCDAASTSDAVWALSADGRICGRNARTATLTSNPGSLLGERAGMLWPCHPPDRVALHTETRAVLGGIQLRGQVPIRDRAGMPRYIAHIRYCRREAFLTWLLTDAPAALVVLQPLACDPATLAPTLIRLYRLTPAECRVAVKLLELESIQLVAAALNRSDETVRSQVKAVFIKTGTHTQAQLLRLLYALGQH
jgi:DNA-binding CsgD family transcriptional regulator